MKPLKHRTKSRLLLLAFGVLMLAVAMTPLTPESELKTRLMVDAVAIDLTEEGVVVTAETSTASKREVVTGKGRMLSEALYDVNEQYGRHLELGHCGLIVLGNMLTKDDMTSIFRSLLSDAEINAGCSVIGAEGEAGEFMRDAAKLIESTNDGIAGYVTFADSELSVTVPSVLEFMQSLVSKSGVGVLPVLGTKEKKGGDSQSGGEEQSPSGGGSGSPTAPSPDGKTEIVPVQAYRVVSDDIVDCKLEDVMGLIWIRPRAGSGMVETNCEIDGRPHTVRSIIEEKDASVSAAFEDRPTVTLSVKARLRFVDRHTILREVEGGKTLDELVHLIAESYRRTVIADLEKVTEMARTADLLGFRTALYRADAQKYKAWSGDMGEIEVRYEVSTEVV